MSLSSSSLNSSSLFLSSFELLDLLLDEEFELLDFELEFDLGVDFGAVVDFDDDLDDFEDDVSSSSSSVSFEFLSVSLSFDGFEVAFVLLDLPLDTDVSMVIVSITIGSIGTSSIFDEATVPVFTEAISSTISIPSVTLPNAAY